MKLLHNTYESFVSRQRDPRYVFVLLGSAVVFLLTSLQVLNTGLFDSIERPVFEFVNSMPQSLHDPLYAATQFGGISSLIIWVGIAWYLINRRGAVSVAATGFLAWTLAKVAKVAIGRGRPQDLLTQVHLFSGEIFSGQGFPSGHATFSAACATILYYQIAKKYRKYLLAIVFLVGLSRMYLGAHFPLDIVGGWALGAFIGAAVSLAIGVSTNGLSLRRLRSFLIKRGYEIKSLKFASVDARGSRPIFMTLKNGEHYFGKIFGKQEHAADWLFKMFRFFRYKNLQAEEPYLHRRRNVEMESFAMLWAKQASVRVPKVVDLLNYGSAWVLLQEKIDAKPMSEHNHLLQKSLVDAWKQVAKLHVANVAHRDLRAANLMVDKQGKVWIIDFGFAEVSARAQRQYMDIAELLMSMSLVVGTSRTVEAAMKAIDPLRLKRALPYLQKAVFSGATTKQLRQDKQILNTLREELKENLGVKKDIETADIVRINNRRAISITLMAVFIYIIAPQFSSFKNALSSVKVTNVEWLLPLAIASMMTYVFTGAVYVSLAQVPLKIRQAALVQLAASFMSKILPGGIGSTSLNAKYLTRSGMDVTDTSAVIATQGVIGFAMFVIPLSLFMFVHGQGLPQLLHGEQEVRYAVLALGGVVLLAGLSLAIPKLRAWASKKLLELIESMRNIAAPGRELLLANLSSLAVTLAYIVCLYASLKAFGISLSIGSVVFVYAAAVIARNAIPTPGGLGPLEAAMIGTLVAFGVGREQAFSTVILYRLATFWLPIPFSAVAYKYINAKRII